MHSWLERLKQQSPIGAWSMRGGLPVAGAAHRIEEGACRHSPQDRRDPAMHLDRWDRVLVDQGDGHGLIPVHRTSSAFAETLSWPGRRVETTASRLLLIIPSGKRAVHTLQRFPPDTHYGAT